MVIVDYHCNLRKAFYFLMMREVYEYSKSKKSHFILLINVVIIQCGLILFFYYLFKVGVSLSARKFVAFS